MDGVSVSDKHFGRKFFGGTEISIYILFLFLVVLIFDFFVFVWFGFVVGAVFGILSVCSVVLFHRCYVVAVDRYVSRLYQVARVRMVSRDGKFSSDLFVPVYRIRRATCGCVLNVERYIPNILTLLENCRMDWIAPYPNVPRDVVSGMIADVLVRFSEDFRMLEFFSSNVRSRNENVDGMKCGRFILMTHERFEHPLNDWRCFSNSYHSVAFVKGVYVDSVIHTYVFYLVGLLYGEIPVFLDVYSLSLDELNIMVQRLVREYLHRDVFDDVNAVSFPVDYVLRFFS